MEVAVIIPIYKTELSRTEEISLQQCLKVLKNHTIIMACPHGLKKSQFEKFNITFEEFENHYFKSIEGYNKLLLESHFYQRFLRYKYILIYQLDAFVFKDELYTWCKKDYDYIGAPWLASNNIYSKIFKIFDTQKLKKRRIIWYKVGNGGLSLRKTKSFFEISQILSEEINIQLSKKEEIFAIEDVFWSLKVPEYFSEFSIPPYKEAARFALDRKPKLGLKLNNSELPFACHGFNKPKVIKFWMPIINKAVQN